MSKSLLPGNELAVLLQRAVEDTTDAVLILRSERQDPSGSKIVYANPAVEHLTGYTPEEVLGRDTSFLQGPLTDPQECRRLYTAMERGEKVKVRLANYRKDGSSHLVEIHVSPVTEDGGEITHYISIQREAGLDVDYRELRESNKLFKAILDTTMNGVVVFHSVRDGSGQIKDFEFHLVNDRMARILGRSPETLVYRRMLEEFPGTAEEGLFDAYRRVAETGEPFYTEVLYQHEGLDIDFRISAVPITEGVLVTLTDISELKHRERSLRTESRLAREASRRDSLTGLANRAGLEQWFDQLREADDACYALVFIDLDQFKQLNDEQGHEAGDRALKQVAQTIAGQIRAEDFVARVGGDEFVVALHIGSPDEALSEKLSKRLLKGVRAALPEGVGASGGVRLWDTSRYDVWEILAQADQAMYESKRRRQANAR